MAIVKVICKDLKNNPQCPHGPTLKFVRIHDGVQEEFFACSTYRDRKDCGFYLAAGDKHTDKIKEAWELEKKRVLPSVDHVAMEERLREVGAVPPRDRVYCHSCGQLDVVARRELHGGHDTQTAISDHLLTHPSQMLKPQQGSKKEAQYLFSASTTKVIVDNLQSAGVTQVLCLGTPRVHEYVQDTQQGMTSLLLDLDHRYHSFWPPSQFVWYNMFNRHVFSREAKHVLLEFLARSGRKALVLDPPFGGHVDPLAATIKHFVKQSAKKQQEKLIVVLAFPYFRERHVLDKCPSLSMLDYKVDYANHREFHNGGKGRKLGSPVRLFTNVDVKTFVLPASEGYRLCRKCSKWVSQENKHCSQCNTCPSKDGRTYVHCAACARCVKPQWRHCAKCQQCLPTGHDCATMASRIQNDENIEPRHKRLKVAEQDKVFNKKQKLKKKKHKK